MGLVIKFINFLLQWPEILVTTITTILAVNYYIRSKGNVNKQEMKRQVVKDKCREHTQDAYLDDGAEPAYPADLPFVPYAPTTYPEPEMLERSAKIYDVMTERRSVRHFSTKPVPIEVIRNIIKCAATSPSGIHNEPWVYVLVGNPKVKADIREIIEKEEVINYKKRLGKRWVTDLIPLRTTPVKQYLTDAPYVVVVFKKLFSQTEDGQVKINYYHEQAIYVSVGVLNVAVRYSGLAMVVSTPMGAGPGLLKYFNRPANERCVAVLPIGYPADDCQVPVKVLLKIYQLNIFNDFVGPTKEKPLYIKLYYE